MKMYIGGTGSGKSLILEAMEDESRAKHAKNITPRQWIGSESNRARAREHDAATTAKIREEPNGQTWQCPRCGNPLDLVAEHAFSELWECAQCGYSKQVKQ